MINGCKTQNAKMKTAFKKRLRGEQMNDEETMIVKKQTEHLKCAIAAIKGKLSKKSVQDAIVWGDNSTIYTFSCT